MVILEEMFTTLHAWLDHGLQTMDDWSLLANYLLLLLHERLRIGILLLKNLNLLDQSLILYLNLHVGLIQSLHLVLYFILVLVSQLIFKLFIPNLDYCHVLFIKVQVLLHLMDLVFIQVQFDFVVSSLSTDILVPPRLWFEFRGTITITSMCQ